MTVGRACFLLETMLLNTRMLGRACSFPWAVCPLGQVLEKLDDKEDLNDLFGPLAKCFFFAELLVVWSRKRKTEVALLGDAYPLVYHVFRGGFC